MIRLVDEACGVMNGKLVITLESEQPSELFDNQTLKFALDAAQARFGWMNVGISGQDTPMPVDENGNVPNDYTKLAELANNGGVKYRKKIYLTGRI